MAAKRYEELGKFDDDVLDEADKAYEQKHGDYYKNERENESKARADYLKEAERIHREKGRRGEPNA